MKGQIIQATPFEFLNVIEYHGTLSLDEHGIVIIKGIIKTDKEKRYLQLISEGVWTEIFKSNEDGSSLMLFCGVAMEGQINAYGNVKELTLKVVTGSCLMDVEEHTSVSAY